MFNLKFLNSGFSNRLVHNVSACAVADIGGLGNEAKRNAKTDQLRPVPRHNINKETESNEDTEPGHCASTLLAAGRSVDRNLFLQYLSFEKYLSVSEISVAVEVQVELAVQSIANCRAVKLIIKNCQEDDYKDYVVYKFCKLFLPVQF